MTTTVLRAVKIVGQGIEEIKGTSLYEVTKEIIEFTAYLILPIALPLLVIAGASY